jgi:hypothetical protein
MPDLGVFEIERPQPRSDILLHGGESGRVVGEADEDQPLNDPDVHSVEPEFGPIEVLRHPSGMQERPVKPVAPLVIRADEGLRVTRQGRADPRTAVPAHVEERPDRSVRRANNDDRLTRDRAGEVVPGSKDQGGRARIEPMA